jgi:RNA polymerase sigma-70 factor (ECF subfamily)
LRFDDDDVMQSVFRTLFRRVAGGSYTLPDGDELWGLLLVITLNKVRALANRHRAVRRSVHSTLSLKTDDVRLQVASETDQQSAEMLTLTVREFADELTPDERVILDLRMQGFGVAEIATKCGRTRRTVERILQKLRHSLRKRLDD